MSRGNENLHPQPDFFFQKGGGPMLDMGPYYLTALIVLLGPIASVQATGQRERAERMITNPHSPRFGDVIKVDVLTSVHALISFRGGQQITFVTSWDVWRHGLPPIEIHGSEGSLRLPDPDWFGGDLFIARGDQPFEPTSTSATIFGRPNQNSEEGNPVADYRGLGLADMTRAIAESRPHRASIGLALHTLAVMNGILEAAEQHGTVAIAVDCDRPQPILDYEARSLLASAAEM
jgi:predicted dehydrogenase